MPGAALRAGSLRLTDAHVAAPQHPWPRAHTAPTVPAPAPDPRWVIAVAITRNLEGGRAAILTPESRRRVSALAHSLGLRPFDTALIIAIVQDAARRGEPLGGLLQDRLAVLPEPPVRRAGSVAPLFAMSALLGLLWFLALNLLLSS